jgi:WD40 repeat protein
LHAWDISADGSLCLENFPEKPPAHPGGLAAVAFAPDGRMAASAGAQGLLMIWNLGHSKEESWQSEGYTMLPGVAPGLHSLTFLAGGRLLAGAGVDRRIYVWDLESGGVTWRVLGEHHGNVVGLAPIPGINWLACAGDEGSIGICDLVSGSFLRWLQAGNSPICAMRMLDDGKHLMSFSANGMLRTWNIHSGELSHHAKLVAADSSPVDLLDCALSSSLAYAAGRRTGRNEVMVWSLDGEQFRSASEAVFEVPAGRNLALPGAVGPVAFLPGRPWILVASAARLMAWDILHLTPHVLFEGSSEFISLAVQPSGGLVAAGDRAGNCHLMALKGYSS